MLLTYLRWQRPYHTYKQAFQPGVAVGEFSISLSDHLSPSSFFPGAVALCPISFPMMLQWDQHSALLCSPLPPPPPAAKSFLPKLSIPFLQLSLTGQVGSSGVHDCKTGPQLHMMLQVLAGHGRIMITSLLLDARSHVVRSYVTPDSILELLAKTLKLCVTPFSSITPHTHTLPCLLRTMFISNFTFTRSL